MQMSPFWRRRIKPEKSRSVCVEKLISIHKIVIVSTTS
jgi:hypothetical protein